MNKLLKNKISILNSIKVSIGENNIIQAINDFQSMAENFNNNDIENQILMLKSRYVSTKNQQISGVINSVDYELIINKIKSGILELADSIKKEILIVNGSSEIFIKKIGSSKKITLKYFKRSTKETFQFKVNPNIVTSALARKIMSSLEPNHENGLLFRDGRVIIKILMMLHSETKELDMNLTLAENKLEMGNTIVIDLEIKTLDLEGRIKIPHFAPPRYIPRIEKSDTQLLERLIRMSGPM